VNSVARTRERHASRRRSTSPSPNSASVAWVDSTRPRTGTRAARRSGVAASHCGTPAPRPRASPRSAQHLRHTSRGTACRCRTLGARRTPRRRCATRPTVIAFRAAAIVIREKAIHSALSSARGHHEQVAGFGDDERCCGPAPTPPASMGQTPSCRSNPSPAHRVPVDLRRRFSVRHHLLHVRDRLADTAVSGPAPSAGEHDQGGRARRRHAVA
jgi:hypothetical protein